MLGVFTFGSASNFSFTVQKKTKAQLCGVIVNFYDVNGNFVRQQWYTSDQPNYNSCQAYQASVIEDLTAQGYTVKIQKQTANPN